MNETSTGCTIITVDQFDSICRTCLCNLDKSMACNLNSNLLIPEDNDPKVSLMLVIRTVLSEVTRNPINFEDTLPKNLCQQCLFHLSHTYQFISKCKKSENILQTILKCNQNTQNNTIIMETEASDLPERTEIAENIITKEEFDSEPIANVTKQKEPAKPYCDLNENSTVIETEEEIEFNDDVITEQECDIAKQKKCTKLSVKETVEITENTIAGQESNPKPIKNVTKQKRSTKPQIQPYCDHCDLRFKNLKEYYVHKRYVKHPLEKKHECKICLQRFISRRNLSIHIKIHKKERSFFCCELCSETFASRKDLKSHVSVHYTGGKPFKCEVCFKEFSAKSTLKVHVRSHTGERPYLCTTCGKSFIALSGLNSHLSIHQPKDQIKRKKISTRDSDADQLTTHECTICKKQFDTDRGLKLHNQIKHCEREKQFLCPVCGGRYASKHTLQDHLGTHTNEKPYKCQYCDKCFQHQSALRSHTFTHTGEKPYTCKYCQRKFRQSSSLRLHVRFRHTKERPYVCAYCAKGFAVKQNLIVHERTHTGEKPFKCSVCSKAFADSSSRKKHMLKHIKRAEKILVDVETEDELQNAVFTML